MPVIITVSITYDMEDETRSLQDELTRWIKSNQDVLGGHWVYDWQNSSGKRAWSTNWSTIKIKMGGLVDRRGKPRTQGPQSWSWW